MKKTIGRVLPVLGRSRPLLAGVAWAALVLVLHLLGVLGDGAAAVLCAAGLFVAGLLQLGRWHRTTLTRLTDHERALESLSERLAAARAEDRSAVSERLDALRDGQAELAPAVERVTQEARESVRGVRKALAGDLMRTYHQLEATQNLYAVAGVDRPLPPARDWACSPDLLLFLVDLVDRDRPRLIVECGSGLSTVWFAKALRRFGVDGRVIALEHLSEHVGRTRDLVDRHGVGDLVEVREAFLEPVEVDGAAYDWYAASAWADLTDIDLLFVDGPPAETNTYARLPALPLLEEHLSPSAAIVLDDMVRAEEQEILRRWLAAYPAYSSRPVRLEKHAALVRRAPDAG